MAATDRVKEALAALLGWGYPRVDYFTTYRAKVVKQSSDLSKVDIKPDDTRIPQRSDVPIKWGLPGVKAQIAPGCYVNHGWDNGDPSKPFVALIEGGATVLELTIESTGVIYLGSKTGAKSFVTKEEFNAHQHSYNPGPSAAALTVVPSVPAVGTLHVKGT